MNNELQELFKELVINDYNIRILHWKVVGLDFGTKHELMDEYHAKLNECVDGVGEIILMNGGSIQTLDNLIKDYDGELLNGNDHYTAQQVLIFANRIFEKLIDKYQKAIDSNIPGDVKSKLEEDQFWFRKECKYKLKKSLILSESRTAVEAFTDFCNEMSIR